MTRECKNQFSGFLSSLPPTTVAAAAFAVMWNSAVNIHWRAARSFCLSLSVHSISYARARVRGSSNNSSNATLALSLFFAPGLQSLHSTWHNLFSTKQTLSISFQCYLRQCCPIIKLFLLLSCNRDSACPSNEIIENTPTVPNWTTHVVAIDDRWIRTAVGKCSRDSIQPKTDSTDFITHLRGLTFRTRAPRLSFVDVPPYFLLF